MRHGNKLSKLNRPADQRKAMMRTLTTEVLNHGKITTTKVCAVATMVSCDELGLHDPFSCQGYFGRCLARADDKVAERGRSLIPMLAVQTKAKVLRKYVDKMIALAKDGSLHARRQVHIFRAFLCNSCLLCILSAQRCDAAGVGLRVQQEDRGAAV